jgi:hypothetical protein
VGEQAHTGAAGDAAGDAGAAAHAPCALHTPALGSGDAHGSAAEQLADSCAGASERERQQRARMRTRREMRIAKAHRENERCARAARAW